jgi:hypothetical protein
MSDLHLGEEDSMLRKQGVQGPVFNEEVFRAITHKKRAEREIKKDIKDLITRTIIGQSMVSTPLR